MFKYLLRGILAFLGLAIVATGSVSAQSDDFFYDVANQEPYAGEESSDLGVTIEEDGIDDPDSLLNRLREAFGIGGVEYQGERPASAYISIVINYFLALVSFVALLVLIYGFYMMFFSEQEEWFAKAKKILIGAATAILIIAISWVLISFIFSIFDTVAQAQ